MTFSGAPLPARVATVAADVVDASGLGVRAAEVAARQRSPQTRRTYASVYRSLLGFLGEHATVEDLTPEAVRSYRDALEHADRTPATVAKHLSAIRGLAAAGRSGRRRADRPLGERRARRAARPVARGVRAATEDARPPHPASSDRVVAVHATRYSGGSRGARVSAAAACA
jgi:Phage integrase, N-terminal SAM-like domain